MTFLFSLAALAAVAQAPGSDAPRLLMQPTIHGDTVVFSYASDLWSADIRGGDAHRLTSGYGPKAFPAISPDGTMIAFTAAYDGAPDVYVIPIGGGTPKRLTYNNATEFVQGWTPDNRIAFTTTAYSPYEGRQMELFTVSPNGGIPEPTPVKEAAFVSYFPSGDKIAYTRKPSFLFNWRRYRGGTQGVVSIYDLATNKYSELPHGREQQYYPMVVGSDIYYVSDKGDGVLNLYRTADDGKSASKLTNFTGEDIKWAKTDGKRIVFSEDQYVWVYDIATGKYRTLAPHIVSDELLSRPHMVAAGGMLHSVSISPTGARVAVDARGKVFSIPAHTGQTRLVTTGDGAREQMVSWAPDGQTIAFVSDASGETEIYTRPQMGGPETQITALKKTIVGFGWSPDGSKMLVSTIDGDSYVVDVPLKKATLMDHSDYGIGGADWSPDSKWIAFTEAKVTGTTVLKLYNVASGTTTAVTNGAYQDGSVAFDQNGKYLYMVSARTFAPTPDLFGPNLKIEDAQRVYVLNLAKDTPDPFAPADDEEPVKSAEPPAKQVHPGMPPKPAGPPISGPPSKDVKIDLDGLGDRILPLPLPPGNYGALYTSNDGVFFSTALGLSRFDIASKQAAPVLMGPIEGLDFTPDRSKLAYFAGPVLGEISIGGPPQPVGAGRIDTSGVEFVLKPRAEWKQIFWEAWRFIRDHYYDVNFRGMNWKGIGEHYAELLPYCSTRADVNVLLNGLLSELGTSHSYLEAPGDVGPAPRPMPVGYLGADYEVVGHAIRFKKIYRGESDSEPSTGPLGVPGVDVHEGDYLVSIDGQPVSEHTPPAELLLDKVGKVTTLVVNSSPTSLGARTVRVRPVGSEAELRYDDFVERSRAAVDKASGGRIGYMHIRDTEMQGSSDFARSYEALTDKDALIVDERWNGGGYPDPKFVEALATRNFSMGQSRNGGDGPITPSIEGPMAMLINGYAGSGGDLFPWTFKRAGLGPLIGMRTWGGLVGIGQGADLVDGGSISTPSFSVYDPTVDEIIAENHGIDPDIKVDNRPDLVADGEDPQLQAAIKYLMDKLAHMPPKQPRVKLPAVNKAGQIGK